ncbi:MAG: RNA methyltransferase [Ignavibacteria bacterium]|nr:RNA methyltransferase [Ignavibacteria bacterium]
MNILTISSLNIPSLLPYRTLRRPEEHLKQNIFVAEGEKVVRRLLESELEVVSVLLTPEWLEIYKPILEKRKEFSLEIFLAEKKLLNEIVGFQLHQGIMAMANVPQTFSLEETARKFPSPFLFVALDGVANAENMGVIVRNCSAFGVDGILVGETSCSPYLRRAVRNSMGTIFKMRIIHSRNLASDLQFLSNNFQTAIIAAHPHKSSQNLQGFTNLEKLNICIVFGNEGTGISQNILDICAEKIIIPMMNETDSINVASAVAVILWEIRQRFGMVK